MPSARSRTATALFAATLALLVATDALAAKKKLPPAPPPPPYRVALEAALGADPALYLVLDTRARELEVRARGLVLDRVKLAGLAVVRDERVVGGQPAAPLALPAIWRVVERSGTSGRELVSPSALQPYSEEEAGKAPPQQRNPPKPPAAYEIRCDSGWTLAIAPELPSGGFFSRWGQAIASAWSHLWGVDYASPPVLAAAIPAEDAQRLHHLFRLRTAILVD